jgi:H+/gluconate symporter-like permease
LDTDLHARQGGVHRAVLSDLPAGALFGKLMEASGSVESIAKYMTEKLGTQRAILAVVLAGAFVTYGGVSLFVAFFVLTPMGHAWPSPRQHRLGTCAWYCFDSKQ